MEEKIIVLDDDIDDLKPLSDVLKIFEYKDYFATTVVQEAIDAATEDRKGQTLRGVIFVTDYHMGKTNGYQVMKTVLEINPIVHFIFISHQPTVPILIEIINLGTGFFFLDKNQPDFYQKILVKLEKARTALFRKMQRIIDMENHRIIEENRQRAILEAASDTLKILIKNGERGD